ncbi:TIGR03936 family radical SAM-associated protein [Lachnospiraceae bacterium 62-35]
MKIRIKFRKQGAMKFVGHLDVMRYFQKAMRRGDIDIRYSEGFSPHQIMSFASPLGVGLTSNGEYMDIEVSNSLSSVEMVHRLNEVMTEGFQILSWRRLPDDAKNAMSLVTGADYTAAFRKGYEPEDLESFFKSFSAFCSQESIPVMKKTKKGEKRLDIRPLIYQHTVIRTEGDEYAPVNFQEIERPLLFIRVSAGSADNLKPEVLLSACCEKGAVPYTPFAFEVQREELYGPGFCSLDSYGEEIL